MSSQTTQQANETLVRTHLEHINQGDLTKLSQTCSPKIVIHLREAVELHGLENLAQQLGMFQTCFANLIDIPLDIRGSGDRVYVHALRTGALVRSVSGIPAEGQTISIEWMASYRIENGKIVERWSVTDEALMLQQISGHGRGCGHAHGPGGHGHSHGGSGGGAGGAGGSGHGHSHGGSGGGGSSGHGHSHGGSGGKKGGHGHSHGGSGGGSSGHGHSHGGSSSSSSHGHSHAGGSSSSSSSHGHSHGPSAGAKIPVPREDTPSSITQVDTKFWNSFVKGVGDAESVTVDESHVQTNPLWHDYPLQVKLQSGTQLNLVARMPQGTDLSRSVAATAKTYQRDIEFHRDWAPKVAVAGSFQTPRLIYAARNPDTDDSCLIFENVENGVAPSAEIPLEEAQRVVVAAAILHSLFWQQGDNKSWNEHCRQYPWLIVPPATQVVAARTFRSTWPAFLECQSEEHPLPAVVKEVGDLLVSNMPQLYRHNLIAPLTVCHNELKTNAFVLVGDKIYVKSWAEAGLGRGVRDIANFLAQAVPSDLCANHHADLLKLYHETLTHHGVQNYSYEDCVRDFKIFATLALATAVCNATGLLRLQKAGRLREDQETVLAEHQLLLSRAYQVIERLDLLSHLKEFVGASDPLPAQN